MAGTDKLFDQQVHDAYERIELGDEARERMLSHLLAAQEQARRQAAGSKAEESVVEESGAEDVRPQGGADHASAGEVAEVIDFPRRRRGLPVWLPVAAVLAAALVIVRASGVMGSRRADSDVTAAESPAIEKSTDDADLAVPGEMAYEDGAEQVSDAESMPLANESEALVSDAVVRPMAEVYPLITLEDGTRLTTLGGQTFAREVDASLVGASIGVAQASDPGSSASIACEVFELTGEAAAYAVRYEGESAFWRCAPEA